MKKNSAIILSLAMLMVMCPSVMAQESEILECATEMVETGTEISNSTSELPEEPEIIHIEDGEALPDYFYVVPKEKILAKGDFSDEGLHAYIAIAVRQYLDENNLSENDLYTKFSNVDIDSLCVAYGQAIQRDEFSYDLKKTSPMVYDLIYFVEDEELGQCIMRAIFTYCETVGYNRENYIEADTPVYEVIGLDIEKITFSDEQLHYFDE